MWLSIVLAPFVEKAVLSPMHHPQTFLKTSGPACGSASEPPFSTTEPLVWEARHSPAATSETRSVQLPLAPLQSCGLPWASVGCVHPKSACPADICLQRLEWACVEFLGPFKENRHLSTACPSPVLQRHLLRCPIIPLAVLRAFRYTGFACSFVKFVPDSLKNF